MNTDDKARPILVKVGEAVPLGKHTVVTGACGMSTYLPNWKLHVKNCEICKEKYGKELGIN